MIRRETRQRKAILSILRGTGSHPSADWVYDEVRRVIPDISKGTVYRNLKVLREMGFISKLNSNGTASRFDGKQGTHYHFHCEGCGLVFDLDEPVNNGLDERVSQKTGFKVAHHQLEFHGLCKGCQ